MHLRGTQDITELYIFGCAASSIIVDGSVMLPRRVDVLMAEYIRDQIDIPRLAIEGGAVVRIKMPIITEH